MCPSLTETSLIVAYLYCETTVYAALRYHEHSLGSVTRRPQQRQNPQALVRSLEIKLNTTKEINFKHNHVYTNFSKYSSIPLHVIDLRLRLLSCDTVT